MGRLDGGDLRSMQDLVAIGVAYARKQIWIGQGALDSVVAGQQPRSELIQGSVQRLQPAAVILGECGLAAQQVNRGALLLRRLSEQQRAVREVEGRQANLAGNRRPAILPPKAARDHQVDDQKQVVLELEDEPFARAPEPQ